MLFKGYLRKTKVLHLFKIKTCYLQFTCVTEAPSLIKIYLQLTTGIYSLIIYIFPLHMYC